MLFSPVNVGRLYQPAAESDPHSGMTTSIFRSRSVHYFRPPTVIIGRWSVPSRVRLRAAGGSQSKLVKRKRVPGPCSISMDDRSCQTSHWPPRVSREPPLRISFRRRTPLFFFIDSTRHVRAGLSLICSDIRGRRL